MDSNANSIKLEGIIVNPRLSKAFYRSMILWIQTPGGNEVTYA